VKLWRSTCGWKFLLDFVDVKAVCTGNIGRKKEIEKTIPRIFGSCAFSHTLDPKRKRRFEGQEVNWTLENTETFSFP
jgi:hypothetical protein